VFDTIKKEMILNNTYLFFKRNKLLILLFVFYLALQAVFIYKNSVPTKWDDSWFLENTLNYFDYIHQNGLIKGLAGYVNISQNKPPLISMIMVPFFGVLGRSMGSITGYFLGLIIATNFVLFILFNKYKNLDLGIKLFIFSLLNLSPMSIYLGHSFLADYLESFFLFLVLYEFLNKRRSLFIGTYISFGLLTKTQFGLYVAVIVAYLIITNIKKLKELIKLILPTLIIFIPWIITNYKAFWNFSYTATFGYISKMYGYGDLNFIETVGRYLLEVVNNVFGAINIIGIVCLMLLFVIFRRKFIFNIRTKILLFSMLLVLIVLNLYSVKDIRYAFPLVIYSIILIASIFNKINIYKYSYLLIVVVFLSVISSLNNVVPVMGIRYSIKDIHIFNPTLSGGTYINENWKQTEILELLEKKDIGGNNLIIIVGDCQYFNLQNFGLASKLRNNKLLFATTAYFKKETSDEDVMSGIIMNKYFIYKERGTCDAGKLFTFRNENIMNMLKPLTREIGRFNLPDSSDAIVLEKI
jgi:hypothetical protein